MSFFKVLCKARRLQAELNRERFFGFFYQPFFLLEKNPIFSWFDLIISLYVYILSFLVHASVLHMFVFGFCIKFPWKNCWEKTSRFSLSIITSILVVPLVLESWSRDVHKINYAKRGFVVISGQESPNFRINLWSESEFNELPFPIPVVHRCYD